MHERKVEREARNRARIDDEALQVKNWQDDHIRKEEEKRQKNVKVAVEDLQDFKTRNEEVRCTKLSI